MTTSSTSLERLGNFEILMKLEKMVSTKKIKAFKVVGGETTPTRDLQEGRVYILQDPTTKKHYVFSANSHGGMFSEEGDQTIYHNWSIKGIDPSYSRADISKEMTEYTSYIPDTIVTSKLSSSHDTHWHAGSGIDYIEGKDSSSEREDNREELFEKILG